MFKLFCAQAVTGLWIKRRKAMAFCCMIFLTLPMVPFTFEKQQEVFVLFNTLLEGSTAWIEQTVFLQNQRPFACVCLYDVGGDSYSLIVMISHLQKAHQGSIEDFNSSLGCWHKALSHYVVLPCWTVAAVMAVLPSFLEVLGISRENHLCANEDYDTAGCNLSVNGSVSDSWAFSLRYWAGYHCQERKV